MRTNNGPAIYFANCGADGPMLLNDAPPAIGVLLNPDAPPMPRGIAYSDGWVRWRNKSIAAFRLEVRKEAIPGRWVCVGRRFMEVEDFLEREAIREEHRT